MDFGFEIAWIMLEFPDTNRSKINILILNTF